MKIKELIEKLKACDEDWDVQLRLDYSIALDEFYIDINSENKLYTIYQGGSGV